MKSYIVIFLLFFSYGAFGQNNKPVIVIDFVKIENNKKPEALYFYENNWKVYRDIALQKGYIKSYELLTTNPDTLNNFDLILVTAYADSVQFKTGEEHFNKIIKEARPNGPKLMDDAKPAEFRKTLFSKMAGSLFSGVAQ